MPSKASLHCATLDGILVSLMAKEQENKRLDDSLIVSGSITALKPITVPFYLLAARIIIAVSRIGQ